LRPHIVLSVLIAVLAAAPASHATPRAKVKSTLEIGGFGYGPGEANVEGVILSKRAACLKNRRVEMFAIRQNGKPRPLSVDRSSLNGFWGGVGESNEPPKAFRVVLKPRDLTRRRTCGGSKERVQIPFGPGFARMRAEFPTTLMLHGSTTTAESVSTDGTITARRACRAKRRVDIFGLTPSGPVFAGFDRASRNGYFGIIDGSASGATDVRAVAPAKGLPGGDTCGEGSDEI
jgi:hypothetical protein